MKTLFDLLPTYRSVEGSRWDSQDDAILASIIHLIGGGIQEEQSLNSQADELFDRVKEYNLLDHMHQQMIRLGYIESLIETVVDDREPAQVDYDEHPEQRPTEYTLIGFAKHIQRPINDIRGWLRLGTYTPFNKVLNEEEVALVRAIVEGKRDATTWDWLPAQPTHGLATVSTLATEYHVKPLDIIHALNEMYEQNVTTPVFEADTIVSAYQVTLIDAYAKRNWQH